ncbi:MAG: protein-export chaperone SecB [Alphaproteobacteria bacterium]|nr:protein-export chaperone SecB [Alphaproteobacteria bacterium]
MTEASDKNAPQTPAGGNQNAGEQPGIQVITQYIKDMSFENPNAPESLISGWPAPDTNVTVTLHHQPVRDDVYECSVKFGVEAKKKDEDRTCFVIEILYGALVVLKNIKPEQHQAVMMVEVPKLMFPFVREIVAETVAKGGYPPLYLTPISFETIYMDAVKRQQEENAKKTGTDKA